MRHEGLVLDIDDTLLRRGSEAVHPDELKAIQCLMAQGVVVVLATGRTRFRAQPLLEQLGAVEPAIVSYGSVVMVPGSNVPDEIMLLPEREVRLG